MEPEIIPTLRDLYPDITDEELPVSARTHSFVVGGNDRLNVSREPAAA